jgi:hypothetical protein
MANAETLLADSHPVAAPEGTLCRARACARPLQDGRWEAWLEFQPVGTGEVLRTPRETVQPKRADVVYWSRGLTPVYLEGALGRALGGPVHVRQPDLPPPAFDGPAPSVVGAAAAPEPSLDPFRVFRDEGDAELRRRLAACDARHLRSIARACVMATPSQLDYLSHAGLIELIVETARRTASDVPTNGDL